jgi:hypothetical protein
MTPRDRDEPIPPPVPAAHPAGKKRIAEALRIPAQFYVEALFATLVLLALSVLLRTVAETVAPALLLFCAVAAFGALVYRMVKRVIAARRKGPPPLEATVMFWASLVLPVTGLGWYTHKLVQEIDPRKERQLEAKNILADALHAEREFFQSYGRYTFSIKDLGLEPAPGARYLLGFAEACTVKNSVEGAKATWSLLDVSVPKPKQLEVEAFFRNVRSAADCPNPKEGFEIFAVGVLKEDAPLDVWKISDDRKLVNVQKGY